MNDDDLDALAAEYVLGTLSADERGRAEALLAIDPGFVEIVRQWERRLGELNVMVEAVEPPAEVWDKIKSRIGAATPSEEARLAPLEQVAPPTRTEVEAETEPEAETETEAEAETEAPLPGAALASRLLPAEALLPGTEDEPEAKSRAKSAAERAPEFAAVPSVPSAPSAARRIERSADVIFLARRVRRWRGITLATGAIAAVLAVFVALLLFAPDLVAPGRFPFLRPIAQSQAPAKPHGGRLVAALQQQPTPPAFLLMVDTASQTLTVRSVSAAPEAGHSYELWLIAPQLPAARSLGVVGDEEFTQRPLPENIDLDTLRAATYEISFEPAGGSLSGVPTGPILFTGKLVESLPPSPPPK